MSAWDPSRNVSPGPAPGGRVDWADVAAGAGHADQAQRCRAVRRSSGESPARLLERMRREECFWVYRLWA